MDSTLQKLQQPDDTVKRSLLGTLHDFKSAMDSLVERATSIREKGYAALTLATTVQESGKMLAGAGAREVLDLDFYEKVKQAGKAIAKIKEADGQAVIDTSFLESFAPAARSIAANLLYKWSLRYEGEEGWSSDETAENRNTSRW